MNNDYVSAENGKEKAILITDDMLVKKPKEELDKRVDFEKGISYFPKVTLTIIALNIIVFIWEILTGALASKIKVIKAGALFRENILQGEYWRLLSSVFLHGSFDHLLGNCVALYILGVAFEQALGIPKMLLLYLLSGLCASLFSTTLQIGPTLGASGAIFGLLGAMIVFLNKYKEIFVLRNSRIKTVLLIWALYSIITGFSVPQIDNFAHIGGFLGGGLAILFLTPLVVDTNQPQGQLKIIS